MSKFKVGDKVRLSAIGRNDYGDDVINPHNSVGTYKGPFNKFDFRHLVEWENGDENQYKEGQIEHVPTNILQVGKTYTSENGSEWECIFIRDGKAWMLGVYPDAASGSAYDFDIDGTASWAGGHGSTGYNIKWGPKRETVTKRASVSINRQPMDSAHHTLNITFDLIDGTPDWTTAVISAA